MYDTVQLIPRDTFLSEDQIVPIIRNYIDRMLEVHHMPDMHHMPHNIIWYCDATNTTRVNTVRQSAVKHITGITVLVYAYIVDGVIPTSSANILMVLPA